MCAAGRGEGSDEGWVGPFECFGIETPYLPPTLPLIAPPKHPRHPIHKRNRVRAHLLFRDLYL